MLLLYYRPPRTASEGSFSRMRAGPKQIDATMREVPAPRWSNAPCDGCAQGYFREDTVRIHLDVRPETPNAGEDVLWAEFVDAVGLVLGCCSGASEATERPPKSWQAAGWTGLQIAE